MIEWIVKVQEGDFIGGHFRHEMICLRCIPRTSMCSTLLETG